jgi:very-short-patch-repair endonuclease
MKLKKRKVYRIKKSKSQQTRVREQYGNKETSIEKKVRTYLEGNGIYFVQEKGIYIDGIYKVYDFMVTNGRDYCFLIEADGTYFHPEKYSSKLTKMQKKNYYNDKKKNKIAKKIGIPLLRFKESDIRFNFKKVKDAITKEIKRQTSPELHAGGIS